ncbi:MMPL family transporter [Sulfolobus acidocaldarius]|uniref:Conserved membrane protein n=4 Tax=Sulfolobus acidocaldarius TaxID=2285 RepID=Q4J8A9_SULAC|nr:MMPL family transporter [Sulfolobus acidocaldarius]AAY80972.1 conserved membrane protein [Sulfolobus acidocaldarius DSM 639]AGE71573.1 hypothetical protein SacN8_08065 [Sulfolobus acidocaldarius N8]AGE73846.1 hypothetical protein SacRon12I_08075 [Sulfolobus acidocaldarius Ron12/I]ALU30202.1 antibiotic transporter [Sulfolobus acidocaldarius]ALU30917.1 antibiotic transporter [Sulfolobus acidocaldarius]
MFPGLAKFIVNKWYVILALWIVVILISAPFTSLFFKSVSYQVSISVPGSTAEKAENIISQDFKISGAAGSNGVLIVEGNYSQYAGFFANLTSYKNISVISFYTIEKDLLNTTFSQLSPRVDNLTKILQNISSSETSLESKLQTQRQNITGDINKLMLLRNATIKIENSFINISYTLNSTKEKLALLHRSMVENYTTFENLRKEELNVNSTATNISYFLYYPVSYFLVAWEGIYNQTHNTQLANQYAYNQVYNSLSSQQEKEYFNLFYSYWSSIPNPLPNLQYNAQKSIENASAKIFNSTEYQFISFMFNYINISNFLNKSSYQTFTITYFVELYHVPYQLAYSLLNYPALQVLISIYHQNTGLNDSFLFEVFNSTNFSELAYQLITSNLNTSEKEFVTQVYLNQTKSPNEFAVSYISQAYNISQTTISDILNFNSTEDYLNYIAQQASNESKIPQWFFISLYKFGNITNLTAYLISTNLGKLQPLISSSNLTTNEFALLLQQKDVNYRLLASQLIINYANFSPILTVNRTLLVNDIASNVSYYDVIKSGNYPIYPIQNITKSIIGNNLLLLFLKSDAKKGNVTYNELVQFQQYVNNYTHLNTVLTGGEPISHQLSGIASTAYSVAIPVGIALAIILAGVYFRSVIAAFMPLTIFLSAYLVASVLLYLVAIKLLGLQLSFLTPSEVLLLALGLGTDYVVFISSRYVEERKNGRDQRDAVYDAVRWGGRAVTITAFIVILSFLFIYIYRIPFFSDTAISNMVGVVIVWLVSITLYPSILRVAGDRLFYPRKFGNSLNDGKRQAKEKPLIVSKKPLIIVGVITAIVLISAIYAASTPLTLDVLSLLPSSQATSGVRILSTQFTSANIFPIYVVIPYNSTFDQNAYNFTVSLYNKFMSIPGVTSVNSPVSPYGYIVNYNQLNNYNYTQYFSNNYILFEINQKYDPFSTQAFNVVKQVDKIVGNSGYVGGGPVDDYNIYSFVEGNFGLIVVEISVTMFVILWIITRSLSVSATIIFVILSAVAITLAIQRLIFSSILGFSIFAVVPLFLVAIIIGIGMDYNIFLVARIHEELEKGNDMGSAVEVAVRRLWLTIAFLGLIFAGTLGSLMLVNAPILQELGFAFAIAAILETTLLWSLLAPSLLLLLYRKFKIRPKMIV